MNHLPDNVTSATVGLVYINVQPPLSKQFLHVVRVLVRVYLRVRFDLPGSIICRDISGFPKFGPITLIRGHPSGSRVVPLILRMISY